MALNLTTNTAFTGRHTAATSDYPYGSAQDETSVGAGDGTPYIAARSNDVFGFMQALLTASNQTPTGNADTALVSQYMQAVVELASGRASFSVNSGSTANAIVLVAATNQQSPTALFEGMLVNFIVPITNTGATTVNAFGLGAKSITDSAAGTLTAGDRVTLVYDVATDSFKRFDVGAAMGTAIGVDQTWQDVLASRSASTIYTNDTLRPIQVNISGNSATTVSRDIEVRESSVAAWVVVTSLARSGADNEARPAFIVPPGHQYRVNGSATITIWSELR